jgi:hypothetical protein
MEEAAELLMHVVMVVVVVEVEVEVVVAVVVEIMAKVAWNWNTISRAMTLNCKVQTLVLFRQIMKMYNTAINLHVDLLMSAGPEHRDFYQAILRGRIFHLRLPIRGPGLDQFVQDSF